MSLTTHPIWGEVRQYLKVQDYGRDGGPEGPRFRLDFYPMPTDLRRRALAVTMPCVDCGTIMHPIRARLPSRRGKVGNLYYAAACAQERSYSCSRGAAAHAEYKRIRAARAAAPDELTAQGELL